MFMPFLKGLVQEGTQQARLRFEHSSLIPTTVQNLIFFFTFLFLKIVVT